MSSNISISVKEVSKCYRMFDRPQDRLKQGFIRSKKYYKEFWALKNVSFDVLRGQTVGIIGRNGSGKSTILQIIANTLNLTSGEVKVNGRVAALLELGSGFNPEFTGRENVIMNCTIMGLSSAEIQERLPLIEEFAEIGDFINQPVKLYSSGMYVRLAFACAINVDPDILVIDEALAVGDMRFQLKCMDKIKSFQKEGKTILFVSHDSYSIRNVCDEAIWMMDGQIYRRGDAKAIIEEYQDYMKADSVQTSKEDSDIQIPEQYGDILDIKDVRIVDSTDNIIPFRQPISVEVEYALKEPVKQLLGGIAIYDNQNNYICGLNTKLSGCSLQDQPGNYKLRLHYKEMNLMPGTYFIDVGFFESAGVVPLDYQGKIKSFRVASGEYLAEGMVYLDHEWVLLEEE
ncbi:ABC transporter ATP-binding protein [Paenibacillus ihumii]|uniref:ABC transporter ATP-binding protein n=1 Tax=Paenibacillus ihumii TaxID=687436 RepID=UPI0006D767BE|nr:ABC transporter ATP-binding protein [Paenibacillus ihumii]